MAPVVFPSAILSPRLSCQGKQKRSGNDNVALPSFPKYMVQKPQSTLTDLPVSVTTPPTGEKGKEGLKQHERSDHHWNNVSRLAFYLPKTAKMKRMENHIVFLMALALEGFTEKCTLVGVRLGDMPRHAPRTPVSILNTSSGSYRYPTVS